MFSPQVELAVTTMLEARRKAGRAFEATHALAVGMIVGDFGFGDRAVVAAILHDTLEDTTLEREVIRDRFGARVLAIVTDVTEPPRTVPWRRRMSAAWTHPILDEHGRQLDRFLAASRDAR